MSSPRRRGPIRRGLSFAQGWQTASFDKRLWLWVPALAGTTNSAQLPALSDSLAPRRTSSASEDDTDGTCSPSEAREIATRVLLKTVSTPPDSAVRLVSSSDISTE